MAKQWHIYRNDQLLGIYSASAVRQGMRDGTFDPFDLASLEDGSELRELIDIEELYSVEADALDEFQFQESSILSSIRKILPTDTEKTPTPEKKIATPKHIPREPKHLRDQSDATQLIKFPKPLNQVQDGPKLPELKSEPGLAVHARDLRAQTTPVKSASEMDQTVRVRPEQDAYQSAAPTANWGVSQEKPAVSSRVQPEMRVANLGYENFRNEVSKQESPRRHSKSPAKKFTLRDGTGKQLGPLSAREVLGLYSKGFLSSSVRVTKIGSGRDVSLRKFLEAYSTKDFNHRVNSNVHGGIQNQNILSLRKIDALKNSTVTQFNRINLDLSKVLLLFLVLFLGAGVYILINPEYFKSISSFLDMFGEVPALQVEKRISKGRSGEQRTNEDNRNRPSESASHSEKSEPADSNAPLLPLAAPEVSALQLLEKKQQEQMQQELMHQKEAQRKERAESTIKLLEERSNALNTALENAQKKLEKEQKQDQVQKKIQAPPAPQPPTAPVARPANYLEGMIGQQVVTAPASYSHAAIDQCSNRCQIYFRDAKGGTFTGIFFKAVYGNVLKSKGTAQIIGTVQKSANGVSIIISGVR